jgi:hypothetical protein
MRRFKLVLAVVSILIGGNVNAATFEFAPYVSVPLAAGGFPDAVKIVDVNNDGLNDLALTSGGDTSSIDILLQRPDTTFDAPIRLPVPANGRASTLAIADINGDNVIDIALGRDDGVTLLLSDGLGWVSQKEIASDDCAQLHIADFNRDGAADLFCQHSYTEESFIMRGDGSGGFDAPALATSGISYFARAHVGDVTDDGYPDILFADLSAIRLFANRGDGSFFPVHSYTAPNQIGDITSGDLDGDGLGEVVAAGYKLLAVYKQDGEGGLSFYRQLQTTAFDPLVSTVDVNADGRLDLIVKEDDSLVSLYMQSQQGLTAFPYTVTAPVFGYDPITTGDINNDGCTDIVTTYWNSLNMLLGMNCNRKSDYDGDGIADLLWHNRATGAGTIWKSANYRTQQGLTRVTNTDWRIATTGDFDGNGQWDIVWRNQATGAGTIWKSGNSATQQGLPRITDPAWQIVGAGDYDGDGKSDLLWRHASSGKNAVWRSGNFATQQSIAAVTDVRWQAVGSGDFDRDGKDDIVWRHATSGSNAIWRSGNHRTQLPVTAVTDVQWKVAAVGDFDGDGNDDLFWRHAAGNNAIWRSAAYAQQLAVPKQLARWTLAAAADYDGNGRDDLMWRNTVDGSNLVWRSPDASIVRTLATVPDQNWRVHR